VGRNLFEYGSSPSHTGAAPVRRSTEAAPTAAPSAPPAVRLVGILHPVGGPRAALAVEGDVVVLTPGGSADGYTLLSIGEEGTVRVRTPSGEEIELAAAADNP